MNSLTGTFNPGSGQLVCKSCPTVTPCARVSSILANTVVFLQGTYTSTNGSSSCTSCSPGTFQQKVGQSFSSRCAAGSISGTFGQQSCVKVSSFCSNCECFWSTKMILHLQCNPGSIAASAGLAQCSASCSLRSLTRLPQLTPACVSSAPCPRGMHSNLGALAGSSSCLPCQANPIPFLAHDAAAVRLDTLLEASEMLSARPVLSYERIVFSSSRDC